MLRRNIFFGPVGDPVDQFDWLETCWSLTRAIDRFNARRIFFVRSRIEKYRQELMMNAENKMTMDMLRVLHPAVESHTPVKNPHDLIPEGGKAQGLRHLAPRLTSLKGKRLALLDNNKVNARELLTAFGKQLQLQHGVAEIKMWRKPTSAAPAPFISEITAWKPDLMLTASGD
jgi:hypothetical protein